MKKIELLPLGLLGLMCLWPFVYPEHHYPITTFYQEWGAVLIGFIASSWILLGRDYWKDAHVPRIVLLPLGMLLVIVIQVFAGMQPYFEQTLLVLLYFLWAAMLMMAARHLKERLGLPLVALTLSIFFISGAEIEALIGIIQYFGWHTALDPYIIPRMMAQVYGNIAQPNHYADYLTLGLVCLLYLREKGKLNHAAAVPLLLPILFSLALSGSRSIWLYLAALLLLCHFMKRTSPGIKPIIFIMLGLLVMNGIVKLPWMSGGALGSVTPIERMFGAANSAGSVGGAPYGGSIRLFLWHEATLMLLNSPLLGIGFGQYAWHHFLMLPSLHATNIQGLYNNAHNVVFMIAAEMGLAGLLVLFGTILPWVRQSLRNPPSLESWWGYALLSVLLIHSMLEYPLWYAHFLGITAILLGLLDERRYNLKPAALYRIPVYLVLIFGLASIQQIYANYRMLEYALLDHPASQIDKNYLARLWGRLSAVQQNSMFRPYAELYMGFAMNTVPASLADKLELCRRVVKFSPNEDIVYKYFLLLALTRQQDEAKRILDGAIWSYPEKFPLFRNDLTVLAKAHPKDYSGLLAYADERHAAYLSRLKK